MAKAMDKATADSARDDARRLEEHAGSRGAYPDSTRISRPNSGSRMFNVRLSEEQFAALHKLASDRHLPMSTMARAWLLDRLDTEQH